MPRPDGINVPMRPQRPAQPEEPTHLLADAMRRVKEAVLITTADLDPPGPEIVYVNEGFCRMTGFAREEIVGMTPRVLQGPKTDMEVIDQLNMDISRGKAFHGRTINYRKDGSEFIMQWKIAPIHNEKNEITHYLAIQQQAFE